MPTRMADVSGAVVILPVIRIERTDDAPSGTETRMTKSLSGRKRRKRAAPTRPSGKAGEDK